MSEFPISVDLYVASSEEIVENLIPFFARLDDDKVQKAIAHFFVKFQQKPGLGAVIYQKLAAYYYQQNQVDLAINLYYYSIQLNPKFELAYYELGNIFAQLQQWEKAINTYNKILEFKPNAGHIDERIAEVYYQQENWEQARFYYQKAVKSQPNLWLSFYKLGEIYFRQQDWLEAIATYQVSIYHKSDFPWSYFRLGECFAGVENWQASAQIYEKAIELLPDFYWGYQALGQVYLKLEAWEKAVNLYQRASQLESDYYCCYKDLAYAYLRLGEWEKALKNYQKAVELKIELSPQDQQWKDILSQLKNQPIEFSNTIDYPKSIKVFLPFPISSVLFSPGSYSVIEQFHKNHIEFTRNPEQADLIISEHLKVLELFTYKYKDHKKYLLYTEEPRTDMNFSPIISLDEIDIPIMNIYTQDVFINNYTCCIWHKRVDAVNQSLSLLKDSHFNRKKNKKVVTLTTKKKNYSLFRDGNNMDLNELRCEIALIGYYLGKVDIYGQGWEKGVSLEDSREGDWTIRKLEILQDYHFNLCFENTIAPYYCTEKIWDGIIAGCLPIYYGGEHSTIYEDFPPNSFIDYCQFNSPIELFNYIDQMEWSEYQHRMNLCINTFNKMAKIMKENQYFIPNRTDCLIKRMIAMFA
ncbi:tetratricopeptide repeat protein [Planktothrix mougeotii]|uniref:Tetratricopeptide repeat protein n=1 Tax=Planktothrix mougeotii LEGE 06226 TaxID=1828728 RepID=A0ABR9UK96_9CYAN|nr:tetratricopeptide repeat protein [Planktothrix mougeotii]MBE9146850.1 tetratricopeptide repeat protein [Planktothrix mougeotii LEGE 06226]